MPLLTPEAGKLLYSSVIVPVFRFNCIINLNLNQNQENKLQSLERRADILLGTKTIPFKKEIEKRTVLLVRKCIDGNTCSNFKDYFCLNRHNMNTRNRNSLVIMPKIKLQLAKDSFYFMVAKILP